MIRATLYTYHVHIYNRIHLYSSARPDYLRVTPQLPLHRRQSVLPPPRAPLLLLPDLHSTPLGAHQRVLQRYVSRARFDHR